MCEGVRETERDRQREKAGYRACFAKLPPVVHLCMYVCVRVRFRVCMCACIHPATAGLIYNVCACACMHQSTRRPDSSVNTPRVHARARLECACTNQRGACTHTRTRVRAGANLAVDTPRRFHAVRGHMCTLYINTHVYVQRTLPLTRHATLSSSRARCCMSPSTPSPLPHPPSPPPRAGGASTALG